MLVKIFNNNKPVTNLLLFLICASGVLYRRLMFDSSAATFGFSGVTFSLGPTATTIITAIGISILTLVFNFLVTERLELIKRNSYLGLLFFFMIGIWYTDLTNISWMFSTFFLMLATYQLVFSGPFEKIHGQIFNIGFFLGMSALFMPQLSWALVPGYFVLVVFGRADFRYVMLMLLGWSTPILLLAQIMYLAFDFSHFNHFLPQLFSLEKLIWPLPFKDFYIKMTVLGVLTLLAIKEYMVAVNKAKIYKKQGYNTFWIFYIFLIAIACISPSLAESTLLMSILPLSILVTNFFQYIRRSWVKELLLWLLLIFNIGWLHL